MRHTLSTMVGDSGCIVCPGVMSMFFKAYKRIATVPTKITTSSELCGRIIYECTLHTSYRRGTVWLRRPSVQWSMKYFLLYCFQHLSETPHNMQQLTSLNRHITLQISLHVTMTFCSSFAYIVYFTTWAATFIEWLRLSWDVLLVFSVFSWKSPLIEHTSGLNLIWTLQSLLRRIKPHGSMGNSTLHQIGALLFSWTLLWESLFPLVFQSSGQ